MHRKPETRWQRFLRWIGRKLMPARGIHARPAETGELPVYVDEAEEVVYTDELGNEYDYDDYNEWCLEDEADGGPFFDPRKTRGDYSIDRYYRDNIPVPRTAPRARPYVKVA